MNEAKAKYFCTPHIFIIILLIAAGFLYLKFVISLYRISNSNSILICDYYWKTKSYLIGLFGTFSFINVVIFMKTYSIAHE